VHHHRDAVAVGFDFGKVPGEGTSQRKAEEKSSAFLIVGLLLVDVLSAYLFPSPETY
jgi:hypothetical protein